MTITGGKYVIPTITKISGLTILLSEKKDMKRRKIITRDKEHFTRVKRSISQEDIIR